MMGWEHRRKYTDSQRAWIKDRWEEGKSAQEVADSFNRLHTSAITRNAIVGIINRLKLPARPDEGPWRMAGARRREANAKLKAETALSALVGASVQKLSPIPEPAPDLTLRAPIGPVGGFPEEGGCKWPVNGAPAFQCCGQPVEGRKSYCPAHAAIGRAAQQPRPMKGPSRADRIMR